MKAFPINICRLVAGLALLLSGCGESDTNCFSGTGEIIRQERLLPAFDSVSMNDNVNVFLIHDSVPGVIVEAGNKIIDGIVTEVVDRNLIIHNLNVCNWTRDYEKPVNVYITSPYLWAVDYLSSGDLSSIGTLAYDSLKVATYGGCGTISLDLDITIGYFVQNLGTADFNLRGECGICYIYAGEYGPFHCEELNNAYCFITSVSSNHCWVTAERILGVTIDGIGNVYYSGDPDSLYYTITGTGSLIHY